ncbi:MULTISPECIES: hypothetical protein [unclassified Desulfovibrio]|uniref:hypothetical protein n=1 Tax=unclassified Desulfovibrio TaxID=2593640 RepID=UPI0011CBAE4D|nr:MULTISPECIES: hypothetical protein [unclassified Desulfovibrio]
MPFTVTVYSAVSVPLIFLASGKKLKWRNLFCARSAATSVVAFLVSGLVHLPPFASAADERANWDASMRLAIGTLFQA